MKLLVLVFLAFLAFDFAVEITLEEPEINETITNAFKINNLDYYSGIDGTEVFLKHTLNSSEHYFTWNTTKTVKKYSSSSTSNITFLNNKTHTLCVEIFVENDTNLNNNNLCKNYFEKTIIEEEIFEKECLLNLMQPSIFNEKAKLSFVVEEIDEYELIYWVEDLHNNIVKKKTSTRNDNTKTFTPKSSGTYLLKAELNGENCFDEAETFFAIKKEENNNLIAELKKINPPTIEIEINSNKFVSKGNKILVEEDYEIIFDTLKGKQEITVKSEEFCGEKEIIVQSDEFEESFLVSGEECEIIEEIKPEIAYSILGNNLFFGVFSPEEDTELYIRKNGKKLGSSEYFEGKGLFTKSLELDSSGKYEITGKVGNDLYSKKLDFEYVEEIKPEPVISKPLITGQSVSVPSTDNRAFYAVLGVIIFLIGDKFLKNRTSRKNYEKERDKSSS